MVLQVRKIQRYTLQRPRRSTSYKEVMYIQKLHRSSTDDGSKSSRKYLGNKQLRKIHQSIPAEYYKIKTDYERINKKISRQKMSIMFNEICSNEEMLPIYIYIYSMDIYMRPLVLCRLYTTIIRLRKKDFCEI